MPHRNKKERIACKYFMWFLGRRDKVYQADGRSNQPSLGRHSLGTNDYQEALRLIVQLDLTMAAKHGLADPSALNQVGQDELPLDDGRKLYVDYVCRARVAGGVRPSSQKRYRAVFDKFLPFARLKGLTTWNRVTSKTLLAYAAHLETEGYAYSTQYLELTTLNQTILWLVRNHRLPAECRMELPLDKAQGTGTYCWRAEEVRAILEHCRSSPGLEWLAGVVLTLAMTGLRISELSGLRWSDIELELGMIRLIDETSSGRRQGVKQGKTRTLKSGRHRSFPIQEELLSALRAMPRHSDGAVFHGPRGGRLKPDVVRRVFIRDVLNPLAGRFPTSKDEVGFADGRLHSFRHFFCSLCANRGVPQRRDAVAGAQG